LRCISGRLKDSASIAWHYTLALASRSAMNIDLLMPYLVLGLLFGVLLLLLFVNT
jgi:Na+/H+-translocating membrane pyrophosphatase